MATKVATVNNPFDLPHELRIAVKLDQLATAICVGSHNFEGKGWTQKHKVALSLVNKAWNSFHSMFILVKASCADDAMSLLRSFVEATINAEYIFHKGDLTADDFCDFLDFRRWIEARDLQEVWPFGKGYYTKKELGRMETRYKILRPRFKNENDWTEVSLIKRAAFLDAHYASELRKAMSAGKFRRTYGKDFIAHRLLVRLPWRTGSAFVHGTIAAVTRHATRADQGELTIGRTTTDTDSAWAMHLGNMTMFSVLSFCNEILGSNKAEACTALHREWYRHSKAS